ncbi:ATP-dependent Clp protease protease subunit [Agromyces flavus]|uniref:ATP-dependent Clp protease proteolytic subunit n=1 Tax=Agromyces flavus TaxID=589382 RepID=A0A1H1VNH8_9MICO|nr:ATP-dependent Clp protease proteolytic subunit [Agromyces flavus]MCP2365975.1 ATP-dependent Clp protease protease subunit [Agromyces flavus]GGI43751.1 putative ATP-dependent Clp protease proteolytic subunit-like protein [Agromyces flavus]SDS86447.1 ATP-dependent Clp protease proteolytic subunit ClpP [Agromyces flavus]
MSSYAIPYVVEKRGGVERSLDVYSRLLSERIVYLGTEIDDGVANVLIAQFLHLAADSSDAPISLYVNSPGGSPSAALAVYDTMRHIRPDVATTCVGRAGGPAAVLLAGGARGQRSMLPHSTVTLHQPSTQGRGTVPDLILHADEVLRVRAELEAALAADTGRSAEAIRVDTDRDLILPAQAAVEYGLADHVLSAAVPAAAGMLAGAGLR